MIALENRLIVALDVPSANEARRLFETLREYAGMFKIGSRLFTTAGPAIVRELVAAGGKVFLDLKYHDIPNTVANAGVEAARLGVSIFNVHAAGGSEMMRRTVAGVREVAEREGFVPPQMIAVTVLTSMNESTLAETGIPAAPDDQVVRLAQLAATSGMDGVVASPLEASLIRAAVTQPNFLIVTPGVRPTGADIADQKRILSPQLALSAGADYLVVGRPILHAPDPRQAAREILEEIKGVIRGAAIGN